MKLSKWQSAGAVLALFVLVAAIMVAGFTWRPVWPGSKSEETSPSDSSPDSTAPPLTQEQLRQKAGCIGNQKRINVAVEVYDGQIGEYPPLGVINENHPLITEGFLEKPPTCPASGDFYTLYLIEGRPRTRCPTGVPDHKIPD